MICIDAETVKLIKSHFDISRIFPIDNIVLLTSEMPSMDQPKIPHIILLILKHDNILYKSRITLIKPFLLFAEFAYHKIVLHSFLIWFAKNVARHFESTELAPYICPHDNFLAQSEYNTHQVKFWYL